MKKSARKYVITAGIFLVLFPLFTGGVLTVDVQPIGPEGSSVGFATINEFIFQLFGENLYWYHITDWLGVVALLVPFGFAGLGFAQLITRKRIQLVDPDLIVLGGFYLVVLAFYVFFELCIINYRPILLNGELEASYPSSHTMIVLCIMGTAILQFRQRITKKPIRVVVELLSLVLLVITVLGRLVSGVHWVTDIIGGLLLGTTLILLYEGTVRQITENPCKSN